MKDKTAMINSILWWDSEFLKCEQRNSFAVLLCKHTLNIAGKKFKRNLKWKQGKTTVSISPYQILAFSDALKLKCSSGPQRELRTDMK